MTPSASPPPTLDSPRCSLPSLGLLTVLLTATSLLGLAGCASGGPGAGVSPATPPSPTPPSARAGAPAPSPAMAPPVPMPTPPAEGEILPGETGGTEGGDGEAGEDEEGDSEQDEEGEEEGEGAEEPPVRARTTEERRAALDRELAESLADFDRRMLDELERTERRRMAAAGSQTGGSSGAGSTGGAGASGEGERGEAAPSGGSDNSQGGAVGGTGGEPVTDDAVPPRDDRKPADIPDGRDDDVVARQLREAALAEEDPELRRRLWDEYRRYKGLALPAEDHEGSGEAETPPAEPTATDSR